MNFKSATSIISAFALACTISYGQLHNAGTSLVMTGGVEMVVDGEMSLQNQGADTAGLYIIGTSNLNVTDDFTNTGGEIVNQGTLNLDSAYITNLSGGDTSVVLNSGVMRVAGDFDVADGYYRDLPSARFHLDGAGAQLISSGEEVYIHYLLLENGGRKTINSNLFADTIDYQNGILDNINDSTVAILGHPVNYSASSYSEGALVVRSANDVWVPVGVNGKFRPVQIPSLGDTNLVIARAHDSPVPSVPGPRTRVVGNNLWWTLVIGGENAYTPTQVALHYDPTTDTLGMGPSNIQVAASWPNPAGPYDLFGGNDATSTFPGLNKVTSWYALSDSNYLALGAGCDVPFAVTTILEGAWDPAAGEMVDDLEQNGYLSSIFEDGGTGSSTMLPGQTVPDSAVDVINLVLRDAGTFNRVDTIDAWLMYDGTIRDFRTGDSTYVKSCVATFGNDYHVEVLHRNHLPVMSSGTFTAALVPATIDLTQADGATIYSWGYGNVFSVPMGLNKSALLAGNAISSGVTPVVNAADMFFVAQDVGNLTPGNYLDSDVNLSGGMDAADFNVTQDNAKNIRFSTSP